MTQARLDQRHVLRHSRCQREAEPLEKEGGESWRDACASGLFAFPVSFGTLPHTAVDGGGGGAGG